MPEPRNKYIRPYGTLVRGCSLLAAAIGSLAWLGLALGMPRLASLSDSLIPMAPSTALLFIIYGLIGFFAAHGTPGRRTVRIFLVLMACCSAISGTFFVLSLHGIYLDIEHLGIQPMQNSGKLPLGHMSPIGAISFLAASFSFAAILTACPEKRRRALFPFWVALLLAAAYSMLSLSYLLGTPMFYGGLVIPPAATTSLAFMALGLALLFLSLPIAWPDALQTGLETWRSSLALIVVFVFLVAGIVSAGFFYQHKDEKQHREDMRSQLSAIADLKLSELTLWRAERLIDAGFYYNNRAFANVVKSYFAAPPAQRAHHDLNTWLTGVRQNRNYDGIFLLDTLGRDTLSLSGHAGPPSPYISKIARESLLSGRTIFSDFYRIGTNGKIHLNIMIPILDPSRKGQGLAILALRIDPEQYLYPLIKRWPMESATAETLIVRREGNDALFLNELRFCKNSALNLKIPLTKDKTPAVIAVLGKTGVVEGIDYRGVAVFAALRAIPDSPWYLVARMDSAEVYKPLQERLWVTVALVFVLLLSAAAFVGFVWRRRNISYYKRSEQDARLNKMRLQCLVNVLQHQAESIQALLDYALSEALKLTSSRYGYIYYYDEEKRMFTLNSWSRDVMPACGVLNAQTEYSLGKTGIWGEAVRQRKPIIINDFAEHNPLKKGYPDGHVPLTRFLTIPIIGQGKITAVVGVANKETDYEDSDVVQLSLLMDAVWKEVGRKRYEEELQQRTAEMERFTYTVSHDLKSPLVTITAFLGYLETDIKNNDEVRIRKDLGYMRNAAEKMGRLLTELLELSRVGRIVSNPQRVSFREIVQEALQLVAGQISERTVTVTVPEKRVMLSGDQPRLVEICQNLLENAVKYMGDQPEPRIDIGVELQGEETVFFVRDNGMGIDKRYHENIFGLFNKLDANSEGSGLGLALVKRIVEIHGGRIWVESDGEGCGACFRFTLPKAVRNGARKTKS
jgi:signal transduction histidine kinase